MRRSQYRNRRDDPPPWFSRPQIVNLFAVPLLTLFGGLIGWYYLTSDTLKRHEAEISFMKASAKSSSDDERKARDEVRKAFMENIVTQTSVLGKIDARLTVQEAKVETTNKTLEKIADKIDALGKMVK